MKKLRGNLLFQLFLALSVTACAFLLAFSGASAILLYTMGYVGDDAPYQQTYAVRSLLRHYQDDVCELLRLQAVQSSSEDSYLEQRQHEESLSRLQETLDSGNTNFRYEVRTYDGALVLSNLPDGQNWERLGYASLASSENDLMVYGNHWYDDNSGYFYSTAPYDSNDFGENADETSGSAQRLILEFGLATELLQEDGFLQSAQQFARNQAAFLPCVLVAVTAALLLLAALCLLLFCAGHRRGTEGISIGWFDRLWFDVLAVAYVVAWFGALCLAYEFLAYNLGLLFRDSIDLSILLWISGAAALLALLALPLLYTFAVRCKSRTLWKSTLCYRLWQTVVRLWHWLGRMFHTLRLSWRLAIAFVAYECVAMLISLIWWYSSGSYIILFILNLIILFGMCYWSMGFQRIRDAGKALAEGDLSFRIDTARMPPDLKAHAEHLNNISQGMSAAVEKQMQSERFKAELITNVSHDLKTPLTSIINYVDLLKKEPIDNPTAVEYIEVLDRKSQRLKKLTEDLVEASKASTGTLPVDRERIGMVQLVTQAVGEYEEKLSANQLTVVTSLPEQEVYVNADGRHLWRILDNLLSNCNKYALPGTRVYVDVAKWDGNVRLSVKNISRDPLNIPAEQLMERFVRGDESRTTEGSGLGLSIARSLAELQGGQFRLSVDGDLFKALLLLPEVK